MCEYMCCACVHGMCFYTNAWHAYISVASPSLVSLMITYSIQKRCFLQDFITVRVCNSHMVSIPTILYIQMVAIEIIGEFYTLTIMNSCFSSVSVLVLASKLKTYCSFRTKSACMCKMYSFSLGPLYNLIHVMKYAIPSLASHSQVPGYSAYETLHYIGAVGSF